jgi:hypothetical protein
MRTKKEKCSERLMGEIVVSSAEGKSLLREAIEEAREQHRKKALAQVTLILERIRIMQRIERQTAMRLALCRSQLEAIDNGRFAVNNFTGTLFYNDAGLNVSWDSTASWDE